MTIKGSVTITIDDQGKGALDPVLGVLDRNIQVMQWSLVAPANFRFSTPPIVFQKDNLPPGYSPWPGDVPSKENDWQVRANVDSKVDESQRYRYDIYVDVTSTANDGSTGVERRKLIVHRVDDNDVHCEEIDPDMENQPQP
jgi:hypothetical protein